MGTRINTAVGTVSVSTFEVRLAVFFFPFYLTPISRRVFLAFLEIWATRETENTNDDRELYIKTTLRELLIYVLFVITLVTGK